MNAVNITNPQSQNRNSSFELLRLILMFLIIIHHGIVHGLKLGALSPDWHTELFIHPNDMLWCCLLNCFCIPAVNVFVLISGYFGIKPTRNKFIKLLVATFLYTFVFSSLPFLILGKYQTALTSCLRFLSTTAYWFIRDYLFLMCFAPLLNMYCEQSSKRNFQLVLFAMMLFTCYFGFLWRVLENVNGYTLFQFVFMYCIGRYLKRFSISVETRKAGIGYAGSTLLCGVLMYVFYRMDINKAAWHMTYYSNPLLIIAAISLVLLFKNFQFSSKFINKVALSSVAIYLVQSSIAGSGLYRVIKYLYNNYEIGGGIALIICVLSILTCVFAVIVDQFQLKLNERICRWLNKIPLLDKWKL